MTEDSKQRLLRYLTGNLSEGQGNNEPQLGEIKSYETTYLDDIENELLKSLGVESIFVSRTGMLNAIANQNENGKKIAYGYYRIVTGDERGSEKGFIAILNNNFELEQVITKFNSKTELRRIQDLHYDEDSNLYGIDGSYPETFRFIMLNNVAVKNVATNLYEVVLRKSYYIEAVYPTTCKKVPNESTYIMPYENYDESKFPNGSNIEVLTLKINVGSENEWKTYKSDLNFSISYINSIDQIIVNKDEDNVNFKVLLGIYINDSNNNSIPNIYEFYNNGDNLSYKLIKTGATILSDSGYIEPINTIYLNDNDFYYKLPKTYYSDTKLLDSSIIHVKDNIETEIFVINSTRFAYTFFNKTNDGINYVYFNQDDKIIYIGRIINNNYYEKTSFGTSFSENTFFNVENNYNLYNYTINIINTVYTLQEVYNSESYNGLPYENTNSLKPKSGRLLGSNNEIIFDRNLYNLSINQNTTTSTIEVPNTLLNDTEMSTEQLISENNNVIISNEEVYTKNIYEQLLINYINTLLISDANDINNIKTNSNASIRLNKSVSDLCDYDDVKMTKYKVYYKNQISDIYWNGDSDIYWNEDTNNYWYQAPQILDLPTPTLNNKKYTYQLEVNTYSGIEKIEFVSNDEQTVYLTLDLSNLENDKKYILKQDVYIKE